MLYWIYDVPALWIVALFAVLFVGVGWLGIFLFRPFVRSRLNPDTGLNEILGDFLQYFGVCGHRQLARSIFLTEFVSAFFLAMRYFFKPKVTLKRQASAFLR